ncbi:DoxX family protein [Glycomyces terrestris]|uniref:DoxX family protein n=1 Tax=Glycomyces terrestris TaxID=2493553 RepID=A0A426UYW7_9ACTN|nr:DoxX family protein [Glycomyces terrestris]RRR99787.1 DoxX family protein [Glycomyces terrestris]
MTIAYVTVTIIAALWTGFSAYSIWAEAPYVVDPLRHYGVPERWWFALGLAKAAGAAGLLAGLAVPAIGTAAGIGLVLYFLGAVATVLRARSYGTLFAPLMYLVPAAAALTLGLLA